jgi:hypothetical protein
MESTAPPAPLVADKWLRQLRHRRGNLWWVIAQLTDRDDTATDTVPPHRVANSFVRALDRKTLLTAMMPAELIIRVSTVAIMNALGGLGMFDLFCVLGWGVWELAP